MITKYSPEGVSTPAIIGFLLPFALLILIALALHHDPTAKQAAATGASASASVSSGPQPTSDEISAANSAILAYCRSDLRQDESCSLLPNSNVTAPGFVESGLNESGQFDPGGANGQGEGLAKGSGSSWSVIWVGQGCVPKDVASQNHVPSSFNICAS